jgi:predicted Zn-dependent protease
MKRALPRGLRGAFCAAVLCFAASLPAAADPQQQQQQQQQQQNQMEMQIGQQEWTQLSQRGEIVQSSQYYPELQQVAQRVAAVADPQYFTPFHFILVNENSPNAMAAPGGNVYVTTSLMRFAQNQDELAAVLCHEVSHDIHHDVVNEQQKDQRLQSLSNFANVFAPFGILGAAATGAVGLGAGAQSKSYSRQAESNADHMGAYTCAQAGFNPYGMVWLFQRMDAMPKQASGGMSSMEMFADHPTDGHRVSDLENLFKSDPATFGHFDPNESTAELSRTTGARIKPVQGYAQPPGRPQQNGVPPQQPQKYGAPPQQPQQYGAPVPAQPPATPSPETSGGAGGDANLPATSSRYFRAIMI